MAKIGPNARLEIQRQAALMTPADRFLFVKHISGTYRCSLRHARRLIQDALPSGRAPRQENGRQRVPLTEEQWAYLIGLTLRYDFAAWHAIEFAERAGRIPKEVISPATYNSRLRQEQLTRERAKTDVKPVRRFQKPYPNHTHHFDTTKKEELFYDVKTGMVTWEPKRKKKNSHGEKAPSIWLYSLVDDCSRAKYARLYPQENQYNHFDFFYRAWGRKEEPAEFPFCGLPENLYMDLGPVNHATALKEAFKKLGVFVIPTTPSTAELHGSRKHGKVERPFQDYDEFFKEVQILAPIHFDELQERLYHYVVFLNNRRHSEIKTAPFARWMEIGVPRETPPEKLYEMLYRNRETRRVNSDLTLSLDGHTYKLPEERPYVGWVKQKVQVIFMPGKYDTINVVNGPEDIQVKELAEVRHPSFNRRYIDETSIDIRRAEVGGINYRAAPIHAIGQENNVGYLPRKGEAFDDSRIAEKTVETAEGTKRPSFAPEVWLTYEKAAFWLRDEGFREKQMSEAEKDWLRGLMAGGDKISETDLREAAVQFYRKMAAGDEE